MYSPLFLVGTQRSGTTLLCRMLSAHSDVYIRNEVPAIGRVFPAGATRHDIESAISDIVKEGSGKSMSELLASEGKTIWGLKDPQLTDHLDALKQFLPDAGFIIITRDARAVVRSYIENAWGLGTNCYTGALRWKREVEAQLAFEAALPENVFRLRYEDLVTNQQDSLCKVCEFVGVPFDQSMLNYVSKESFVTKKRESINTFKAPDPAMIEKWKNGLNQRQIRIINTVCGDVLDKVGYEVGERYDDVPVWLRIYYRLHQSIIGELQIQYRWRIARYKHSLKFWLANKSQKQA
jgi:hypothetical protein